MIGRLWIVEQERSLAEVIEHQRGEDDGEPGDADWLCAEVTHVGVERFAAGDAEKDGAEDEESLHPVLDEESYGVFRIHGSYNVGLAHDLHHAEKGDHGEPDHHHRAEHGANARRPDLLQKKKSNQHDDRDRHDEGREDRRGHFQAFDCAEHGDGRRDHSVAVEKRCSEEAEADENRASSAPSVAAGAGQ